MSRLTMAVIGLLILSAFVLGTLLGGHPTAAFAQAKDAQPDVKGLLQPPLVVAAVPFQSRTEYEQDPFEPNKVRRTENTVIRLLLVHADGSTEMKNVQ